MNLLKIAAASALALATAAPAYAQSVQTYQQTQTYPYGQPGAAPGQGTPYRPTDEYQREQRQYENQNAQYQESQERYRDARADYRTARADYERRRADWEAARASYDARYGVGAYARIYPAPVWDETHWAYAAPSAGYYGANTAYVAPIHCDNGATITGGLLGALGGAAIGGAAGGGTGAVVGAVLGGGVGATVGHERDRLKCDEHGAYYSYSETVPYRVPRSYRDERYAEYHRMGCRLAPAPVSDTDYRYVRVCPDSDGRYRITG